MKKTLLIIVGLMIMSGVVMAAKKNTQEMYSTSGVNNSLVGKVDELYAEMAGKLKIDEKAPSLSVFMATDIYSVDLVKVRYGEDHTVSPGVWGLLMQFTPGENGEYLPVYDVIYNHIDGLIPHGDHGLESDERFVLAFVYMKFILSEINGRPCMTTDLDDVLGESDGWVALGENRCIPGNQHSKCSMTRYFEDREAELGHRSIKKRLEKYLNESSNVPGLFTLLNSANQRNVGFHGISRKNGKLVIDFNK